MGGGVEQVCVLFTERITTVATVTATAVVTPTTVAVPALIPAPAAAPAMEGFVAFTASAMVIGVAATGEVGDWLKRTLAAAPAKIKTQGPMNPRL